MAGYDGSIRINTEINTKNASAQLMTLENRIVKTADKIASLRAKMDALKGAKIPTQEYQEVANQIAKAETEFNKLLEKQKQMQREGKDNGVAWERLNAKMKEVGNTIRYAQGELQDLVDTGRAFTMGSESEEYARLAQQLQYAENDLEVLTQRHDELEQRQNNNISKYRQLGNVAADALKKLSKSIYKYGIAPFIYLGKIAAKTFLGIGKSAKSSNNIFNKGFKAILKYGLGIRSLYILVNKLRIGIKEGFSNLYNDRKMADFKSQVDSLKASILTLKNAFAAAFRPIVEIAIPYIQRLIDYITQLLNVVGQFMAAITGQKKYTKAIKQTTAAIEDQSKTQNKQLSGLDKLNNLTSSSGGSAAGSAATDMFEEAPIENKWKDMAQMLKDMWKKSDFYDLGKSIGEWLKNALDSIPWNEIKEKARNLGKSLATLINGFIEVDGLGYSIGRTLAEALNTAFVYLNSFVHEIHWESIGYFIADTLNGVFENIDWELIRDTFVTGFKGLADAINSFVDNFNWDNVSNTISNAINTIAETVYTFFSTVDWEKLGKELGNQLKETIKKIDWKEIGKAIGSVIQAALDFVTGFIGEQDFGEVAQAVADALKGFFKTVDMGELAEVILAALSVKLAAMATASLFKTAAGAILSGLGNALKAATGAFSSLASTILGGISAGIASAGGIGNLLTLDITALVTEGGAAAAGVTFGTAIIGGIIAAFAGWNFGQWLNEVITGEEIDMSWAEQFDEIKNSFSDGSWKGALELWWNDIYNAFVEFGEWESQVVGEWIEAGKNLVEGIKEGISTAISDIGGWINEHIFQPFINGFKNLFGIHSPSTVMEEMGTYIIQGLLDGITNLVDKVTETWESMKEKALEIWENVKTGLSEKWEDTKEKASEIWGNVKDNFTDTWNMIEESASEKWSDIKENLSGKWEDMKTNASIIFADLKTSLSGIWDEISTTVSNKWNDIKTTISGVVDDIKRKIDGFISNIKDAIQSVKDFFSSGVDKIGSAISGAFSGGRSTTSSVSNVSTYSAMPQMAALSKMEFPGYATGQVIPTSMKKHLAWLGDNNHETEVVSPLSTMKQANKEAILEVLSELGMTGGNGRSSGGETFVFQVDGKTFFEITRGEAQKYFSRTGRSPYPT